MRAFKRFCNDWCYGDIATTENPPIVPERSSSTLSTLLPHIRFASGSPAGLSFAPERSAPLQSVAMRVVPVKSAPWGRVPSKSAALKFAPRKSAP